MLRSLRCNLAFVSSCSLLRNIAFCFPFARCIFRYNIASDPALRFPHPLRITVFSVPVFAFPLSGPRFGVSDSLTFMRRASHSFKCASLLKSSPRSISTGPLRTLRHFHFRPIYHVVYMGPYLLPMRNLIFRLVSRLDAFSVYPSPT